MEQGQKLFKYHLGKQEQEYLNRAQFLHRTHRWRANSREWTTMFAKNGLRRGYFKYGIGSYATYYFLRYKLFAPKHDHHHGDHGDHGDHHHADGHGNDHGDHGHKEHKAHH